MEQYEQESIEFMISCETLKFGNFVTKSGRKTPSFANAGFYRTGTQLKQLGAYYACAIHVVFGEETTLPFGPAYKGIPLCVAVPIGMSELYEQEVGYVANRKEVKDHGDKGILLGASIEDSDKIVIVEDVTTAGTLIEETTSTAKAQGNAEVLGPVVSVDRRERGKGEKSALPEISERYGIRTTAIVTMKEVTEHLHRREVNSKIITDDALMERIDAYYREYGAEED